MKLILSTVSYVLLSFGLFAQQQIQEVASPSKDGNWWQFHSEEISPAGFFQNYQASLGLDQDYSFSLLQKQTDKLGITHARYQQLYKERAVEGAQFILHSRNGKMIKANGRLVKGLQGSAQAGIDFMQALEIGRKIIGAHRFYWEIPAMEATLRDIKNDPNATYFPKEELVWIDPRFSQQGKNYKLAYKLDLFFEAAENHLTLYIDAHSGNLLWEEHNCQTSSVSAQAQTRYHGLRDIITDSISPGMYVLKDDTRGNGIETYNALTGTNPMNAIDFVDSDNYWNNINTYQDDAATDAHWSAEMTYDYYLNVHGRDSYDGFGSKIVNYVHWDSALFNANWDGVAMHYGDGNGNPLISIDIVGHELTHGVTGNSAGLIYANESGALNESFSDIFGTAIEFYTLGNAANWKMGVLDFQLRDMGNPKAFSQPDTYFGNNWYIGSFDNGGVHINSGVQNYWFYLLSEGASGTNDLGHSFQIDSLGMENTAAIAYRNLIYYLTPTSDYYDSRRGSIAAAEDIYGNCSYQANLVAKAWYAVGIGADTLTSDVEMISVDSPKNGCDLGTQESLAVSFIYYPTGCQDRVPAGDTIQLGYSINGGSAVTESYITPSPIVSGDTIHYIFSSKEDFITVGTYKLNFWLHYSHDYLAENDTIHNYQLKVLAPMVENDSITFELAAIATETKIYNLNTNEHSVVVPSFQSRKTGLRGLTFTAKDADLFGIDLPNDESENFQKNPSYQSSITMCVDATAMTHVTLEFDLRQTYSGVYAFLNLPNPETLATSLRVTINDNQVGNQFHPTTTVNDIFKTQHLNLDQFAGTSFELTLEGKHFLSLADDFSGTLGDNSFVDNIKLLDYEFIGQQEYDLSKVSIYPNPTNGIVNINFTDGKQGYGQPNSSRQQGKNISKTYCGSSHWRANL